MEDDVRVVEDLCPDGGADLDVLDFGERDLDPSVGREERVDLSVETVFGDEDQGADPADEGYGESDKSDEPETEGEHADEAAGLGAHVAEKIQCAQTAGDDQVRKNRNERGAEIEKDRVIFVVSFFNRFESHDYLSSTMSSQTFEYLRSYSSEEKYTSSVERVASSG